MRRVIAFLIFILSAGLTFSQDVVIAGVVRSDAGAFVVGATVGIKGTNNYVVADTSGRFIITSAKQSPFTLVVSSAGFRQQEVAITSSEAPIAVVLVTDDLLNNIVVTSRRRSERAQDIPIPISVVSGAQAENTGSFTVNRVKELIPTVQLYSSNPRNTTLNIRGLGSTFGLTNDGIDPGVGFYVDGVYYARPAATTLDFIDIDQIEVLRGPQGTLFGKNTTAGAFNITTRPASFRPGANFEVSYGNYGFIQAKAAVTGPLSKKFAGRLSFSGTQRDGLLKNVVTGDDVNDINNIGFKGQLLYQPNDKVKVTFIGDATWQRPNGYAQVFAGVAPTLRAPYRQFENIIADLGYTVPNRDPFARQIDQNTPWRSNNDLGGVSINLDIKLGGGTLTSTSAWRYWKWGPSNDRDFTGLSVLQLSQANSKHQQLTQEVRYAGDISSKLSGVIGVFLIGQDLRTDPVHTEESGSAQWRFSQSTTSTKWATPGLLDGYGIRTTSRMKTFGAAVFGQIDWAITEKFHVLPGIRYNYDKKDVDFNRQTYGGLETTDPDLIAIKKLVYTDQAFNTDVNESNFSGQLTLSFKPNKGINTFATYSVSYKPVGINLGGLPTNNGMVMLELAKVKPESVNHYELGIKTTPSANSTLNLVFHHTEIDDYQTNVQTAEVGVNRGYLANAEKVRVIGVELDGTYYIGKHLNINGAVAYTEGKYVKFTNAPVPLEETGAAKAFKDISGQTLPGISKWAGSLGAELSNKGRFLRQDGKFFFGLDAYYRSDFSSSPSPSPYLNIDGYTIFNARLGFRTQYGFSIFVWGRNILDKDYFEQLLPAAGNAGHYAAVLGDQRTYGITLRYAL